MCAGVAGLPDDPRIRRGAHDVVADDESDPAQRLGEARAAARPNGRERASVCLPGGLISTRAPAGCRTATMFRNMTPLDPAGARRDPVGLQRVRNWLLERLMLESMAGADLTIFISDHARGVIEARIRVPHAITIPHGIGEAFRTHGRAMPRPAWCPPAGTCSRLEVQATSIRKKWCAASAGCRANCNRR